MLSINNEKTLEQLEMDAQIALAAVEQKRKEEKLFIMEEFFADHPEIVTIAQYEAFVLDHKKTLDAYRALSATYKAGVELTPEMEAQLKFSQQVKEKTGIESFEEFEQALKSGSNSLDVFGDKAKKILTDFTKNTVVQSDGVARFLTIDKYRDFQQAFAELVSEMKRMNR